MQKEVIYTENAPAPIGPYSQAIRAGNLLFVSGQIAINPETNEVITGSIISETEMVLKNVSSLLESGGSSWQNVVKTSIFLSDMSFFAEVNSIYSNFVSEPFPARETIAVKTLPKNVNVEISVIAICH